MDYDVPSKDELMSFASKIGHEDLLDFEFSQYSDEINRVLLEIREGAELNDEIRQRLSDLYDEWESEGFPVDDVDDDEIREGGDPDMEPDPQDV